jgi:NAD(P)-dependent dehydrogenase (short-subunit alcohol dehydrogenase family)/GNAT superfamily N-acetyltransferase
MDLGLAGAAVVVVGGSRGIGRASARRFAEEGASVAIAARDPAVLAEAAAEIQARTGNRPLTLRCDCAKPAEVDALMAAVVEALGGLDVLVNSVGAARGGRFLDLGETDWMDSLDGKLHAQIRCCRAALPHLRRRGHGVIVNVIGHRGKQPDGRALPAGVANAGLMNFTVGLAAEEAVHGIRVVGVNPAPVETRRLQSVFETEARLLGVSVEEARRRWLSHVPLGRAADAGEIADVIVFLGARASSPAPSCTATAARPERCSPGDPRTPGGCGTHGRRILPPVDRPSVRALAPGDRDAALAVINTAARWYRDFLPAEEIHDPEMTPEQWEAEARRLAWYGVFDGDVLVAVGGLEHVHDAALLRHGYVLPEYQRRGVGALLREHLERQARGVRRIVVGTYAGNYKARGALAKAGYQLSADSEAVLRAYYAIPEDRLRSSVTYEKPL